MIPGSGRSPGEGNGNPIQYSYLENPMGRGAWRARVHRVVKSQTLLSTHRHTHTHTELMNEVLVRRGNKDMWRNTRNMHRQSSKPREASEETKLLDFRLPASRPMR